MFRQQKNNFAFLLKQAHLIYANPFSTLYLYQCSSRSSSVDRSHKGEERPKTPSTPPPPRTPPPDGTPQRRGDFTRQEYERRHQLKIMEDLDKVLRQKPTTVRGVKKQRPKTVFRDDSDLSRSPAKGFIGKSLVIWKLISFP